MARRQVKCFIPGVPYVITKNVFKNCFFFKNVEQMRRLFLPFLAYVTEEFGLFCHDYYVVPHGYGVIWTMRDQNGDIPKAKAILNNYLDRYLKIQNQYTGPVFDRNQEIDEEPIWSPADAIRRHVQFRTIAQAEGYSASNEIFADAIMPLHWIGLGTSPENHSNQGNTELRFTRPSCVGNNAKIGNDLRMSFPLMPMLQNRTVAEIHNEVSRLTKKARELIEQQKQKEQVLGYLEHEMETLPEPPTPRPRAEAIELCRPRIEFDWITIYNLDVQTILNNQEVEKVEAYKQWLKHYKKALEQWVRRNYEVLFPLGTYKMRVLHKCNIAELEDSS